MVALLYIIPLLKEDAFKPDRPKRWAIQGLGHWSAAELAEKFDLPLDWPSFVEGLFEGIPNYGSYTKICEKPVKKVPGRPKKVSIASKAAASKSAGNQSSSSSAMSVEATELASTSVQKPKRVASSKEKKPASVPQHDPKTSSLQT